LTEEQNKEIMERIKNEKVFLFEGLNLKFNYSLYHDSKNFECKIYRDSDINIDSKKYSLSKESDLKGLIVGNDSVKFISPEFEKYFA
jgi:hypothetical protein